MEYKDMLNPEIWLNLIQEYAILRKMIDQMPTYEAVLVRRYFGIDCTPVTIRQMTLNRRITDAELQQRLAKALDSLLRIYTAHNEISNSLRKYHNYP